MRKFVFVFLVYLATTTCAGCSSFYQAIVEMQPEGDRRQGLTIYVGGAGPAGNVGAFDVPKGLRDAGYRGHVEVYAWQSWTHAGDQVNLKKNRETAAELAEHIKREARAMPGRKINVIALSAGTGIATFALEFLPENIKIENFFLLGCSLSSRYDLTRALKRVEGKLYVLYSPHDRILSNVVWYAGTVDRSAGDEGIAGMEGFWIPSKPPPDTRLQYRKVQNIGYRSDFAWAGYEGGHVGATSRLFVRGFIGPALLGDDQRLLGRYPELRYDTTPDTPPPGAHSPAKPATQPTSPTPRSTDAPKHADPIGQSRIRPVR